MTTNEIIIILLLILIIIYIFKNNKQESNKNHKLKEMFNDSCICPMNYDPVECDGRKYDNICQATCREINPNYCKKSYDIVTVINSTDIENNQNTEHQINHSNNLDSTNNSIEIEKINYTNNSIKPDMSPFKYSIKIQNIMMEIGINEPTEQQINQLLNAINEEVPNLMQFLDEIKNAPKDDKGLPIVDAEKKGLYWLMFILFNISNGKYFSEIKPLLMAAN